MTRSTYRRNDTATCADSPTCLNVLIHYVRAFHVYRVRQIDAIKSPMPCISVHYRSALSNSLLLLEKFFTLYIARELLSVSQQC